MVSFNGLNVGRSLRRIKDDTDMNSMTVTRKPSDEGLSEDIKRDAAKGPVITPDYVVLRREDIPRLAEEIDEFDRQLAAEAVRRARDPQEGPSLEEMQRKYGL